MDDRLWALLIFDPLFTVWNWVACFSQRHWDVCKNVWGNMVWMQKAPIHCGYDYTTIHFQRKHENEKCCIKAAAVRFGKAFEKFLLEYCTSEWVCHVIVLRKLLGCFVSFQLAMSYILVRFWLHWAHVLWQQYHSATVILNNLIRVYVFQLFFSIYLSFSPNECAEKTITEAARILIDCHVCHFRCA